MQKTSLKLLQCLLHTRHPTTEETATGMRPIWSIQLMSEPMFSNDYEKAVWHQRRSTEEVGGGKTEGNRREKNIKRGMKSVCFQGNLDRPRLWRLWGGEGRGRRGKHGRSCHHPTYFPRRERWITLGFSLWGRLKEPRPKSPLEPSNSFLLNMGGKVVCETMLLGRSGAGEIKARAKYCIVSGDDQQVEQQDICRWCKREGLISVCKEADSNPFSVLH